MFNLDGKIPEERYSLHMYVKGELLKGVPIFKF